ncbi:MAG TPA: hypothetical protein VGJ94_13840 [Syntrophorhabdaceae bacterium]
MKRIIMLTMATALMVTSLAGCLSLSYESSKEEKTEKVTREAPPNEQR